MCVYPVDGLNMNVKKIHLKSCHCFASRLQLFSIQFTISTEMAFVKLSMCVHLELFVIRNNLVKNESFVIGNRLPNGIF